MKEIKLKTIITKEDSDVLKGIAIIFMLYHHFITYPNWQIDSASTELSDVLASQLSYATKICVPMFAFITGYAFGKGKERTLSNTIQKSMAFLKEYWIFYFLLLAVSVLLVDNPIGMIDVVKEMFCIDQPIMIFCWYVRFYIISLFLVLAIQKLLRRSFSWGIVAGFGIPFIVFWALNKVISVESIQIICGELRQYFPVIIAGYLVAYYDIYEDIVVPAVYKLDLNNRLSMAIIVAAMFIGRYSCGGIFGFNLDVVYIPFFIFGFIHIVPEKFRINSVFRVFGQYSTGIWFLHCAFFGTMKEILQPYAYWSGNSIIIVSFIVVVLTAISCVIYKIRRIVCGGKRKIKKM